MVPSKVFHVLKRFQDRKEIVLELLHKDKDFRSICYDYDRCARALELWIRSDRNEASVRRMEYANLLDELDQELSRHIDEVA